MADEDDATDQVSKRVTGLVEARRLLVVALDLLDRHSLSAAPASVDLAIHQIDRETDAIPDSE